MVHKYHKIFIITAFFWIFFSAWFFVPRSKSTIEKIQKVLKADPETETRQGFVITKSNSYSESQLRKWDPVTNLPTPTDNDESPGAMGSGVQLSDDQVQETFHINGFNLAASDLIPLNRSLPDFRMDGCKIKEYPELLPSSSVIIVFHNEANSTLLRTVHSVINRSPLSLVEEIILVDDGSEQEHLHEPLEEYMKSLEDETGVTIHLLRLGRRAGLIQARLEGAKMARGTVIVFLDAHCECTMGWLEPLLSEVARDRTTVPTPMIGHIDKDNFQFANRGTILSVGEFGWDFVFRWTQPYQYDLAKHAEDLTLPYISPVMAGGLLAIDREFFFQIGSYDEKMQFWGGENVEMSLRIWRCGGSVTVVPCSHVGHVYRSVSPHSFTNSELTIATNTVRTVEIWGDHLKPLFYHVFPSMKKVSSGDISERLKLRKKLQCKDMKWFLENIMIDSVFRNGEFFFLGHIQLLNSKLCLDKMDIWSPVSTFQCHFTGGPQSWMITDQPGQIRNDKDCLTVDPNSKTVTLSTCINQLSTQMWLYQEESNWLQMKGTNQCLSSPFIPGKSKMQVTECNEKNERQKWSLDDSML